MTAYYNEFDPYAAQWLRNLIAAGHIALGEVDERSIADVAADDVRGFTQCHFFAGIGGWSYALRLAGWPDDRPIWTGSCPCQPFSAAGKRSGFDDERHLWPVFFNLIRECRPPVVLGEQVASKDGLQWLDAVRTDMERANYALAAVDLCAAGLGAPHIRQRLWFVGVADSDGEQVDPADAGRLHAKPGRQSGTGGVADAVPAGWAEGRSFAGNGSPAGHGRDSRPRPTNGHWRDADWLHCRDGKWRPVEPGTFPLLDGLPAILGRLRALEADAWREVVAHAGDHPPEQVLRMVREAVQQEAGGQASRIGVREQLLTPAVLFNFLLCVEAARDRAPECSGFEKASQEVRAGIVRGLRLHGETGCSSRRRQSNEQPDHQPADALLPLSFVLARLAAAHRGEARKAHAASSRVGRLRGYGNAIVPQVAQAFIEAVMECRP